MGCNWSTLEAVSLCRERCRLVDEALRQSYFLADAHLAHMHSLTTLAPALHSFFLLHHRQHYYYYSHHDSHSSQKKETVTDTDSQFLDPPPRFDYANPHPSPPFDDLAFMPLYPPFSPPPPTTSATWDFFNLFETFDRYEVRYSPSQRSGSKNDATEAVVGSDRTENGEAKHYSTEAKEDSNGSPKVKSMSEIQILMQRASDSGGPVLEMLDVGKLRYHRRIAVNPVSCKMMHALTPLLPSNSPTVKSMESSLLCQRMASAYPRVDKDDGGNLSSTLKKLSMWEKKLYDEVKVEERLHALYKKKCRQLNRLTSKKHVDDQKAGPLKAFIQKISTEMKISIQVVDKISNTICKLGEEELWPLISEFIFRFLGMWKEMQECYRCQNQGIEEAKSVEACPLEKKQSVRKEHVEAAIRLKNELQKWNLSFSEWIYAQKCHVKALNGWLLICLPEEEIEDGSAAKISAPSVSVICNKWSEAVDKISEKNVIEAVNEFIYGVKELLDKYISELQQRLEVDKELERRMKLVERQEQKMQKVVKARGKKTKSVDRQESAESEGGVHHAQLFEGDSRSLHCRLKHIFSALENFTASSASAYELLCQHIEQDSHRVLGRPHIIH